MHRVLELAIFTHKIVVSTRLLIEYELSISVWGCSIDLSVLVCSFLVSCNQGTLGEYWSYILKSVRLFELSLQFVRTLMKVSDPELLYLGNFWSLFTSLVIDLFCFFFYYYLLVQSFEDVELYIVFPISYKFSNLVA